MHDSSLSKHCKTVLLTGVHRGPHQAFYTVLNFWCYLNTQWCYFNTLGCYFNTLWCYVDTLGCNVNTWGPLHKTFTGEKTLAKSENSGNHEFTTDCTIGRKLWLK